jgi:hypothetical protein
VDHHGVDPTNNHAERELRAFVLWRRRSFGTQSARGNLFAERLMTVAHTARKQNRHVLSFLVACCQAQRDQTSSPSLFGAAACPPAGIVHVDAAWALGKYRVSLRCPTLFTGPDWFSSAIGRCSSRTEAPTSRASTAIASPGLLHTS